MKIHRAIPVAVLSVAGLVPLWQYEAHTATSTEVAAEVGVVPEAQTQTSTAPPASDDSGYGTAAPPATTTTKPTAAKTVNGKLVKTVHGDVQVQATFTGDKITAVKFLEQPNTGPTRSAVPVLVQETLQAGTADVDSVSGATQTSEAYVESLQSAVDAKGN